MPERKPDDLLATDPDTGAIDVAAQIRRLTRVNNILGRANDVLAKTIADLGATGFDPGPQVQALLQAIVDSAGAGAGVVIASDGTANPADGIIVKIYKNPGPLQDPAGNRNAEVVRTLQAVVGAGINAANAASGTLGTAPPCQVGGITGVP